MDALALKAKSFQLKIISFSNLP